MISRMRMERRNKDIARLILEHEDVKVKCDQGKKIVSEELIKVRRST